MSPVRKQKSSKRKKAKFPGLLSTLFLLMVSGLALSGSLLLPPPVTVSGNARPVFENFARTPAVIPDITSTIKTCPLEQVRVPMLAIVIDDMGYDVKIDMALIGLEAPLSFAFLPYAPHTAELSRIVLKKGRELLVHLPLEAVNRKIDPGPGTLTLDMDHASTVSGLRKAIGRVKGASGLNNHMGSAYTADRTHMIWLVEELKHEGMFLLDSRTTKLTVAYDTAREMGLPTTWRDVFLDHRTDEQSIKKELVRALKIASRNGSAVAIGHPHATTLRVLYRELPRIRKYVKIVPVSRLLCRMRK
jgi:polysaccharide deacetylase 2 family uncharacterized protein YibQ